MIGGRRAAAYSAIGIVLATSQIHHALTSDSLKLERIFSSGTSRIPTVTTTTTTNNSIHQSRSDESESQFEHSERKAGNATTNSSDIIQIIRHAASSDNTTLLDKTRLGALDEQQRPGYRHNPSLLKDNPPSFQLAAEERSQICAPPGQGPEGPTGYKFLTQRLRLANGNNSTNNYNDSSRSLVKMVKEPRILCALYTYEGASESLQAISETWGQKCDGIMYASTKTDSQAAKVELQHNGLPGVYKSIWQKVRSMIWYIGEMNYSDEYDFVHVSGDDVYLIVDNLRKFLKSPKVLNETDHHRKPFFAGGWLILDDRAFKRWGIELYHGGGPGYTLNIAAINVFLEQGLDAEFCNPDRMDSFEDLLISICFTKLGVQLFDSRDELGYTLYHQFDPETVLAWDKIDGSHLEKFTDPNLWRGVRRFCSKLSSSLGRKYGKAIEAGVKGASEYSISFHWIKTPAFMRRFHMLLFANELELKC